IVYRVTELGALRAIALVVVHVVPNRERPERALHLDQGLVQGPALLERDLGFDQGSPAVLCKPVDLHDGGHDGRDQRGQNDGEPEENEPDDRTGTVHARPLARMRDPTAAYSTEVLGCVTREKAGGE